MTEIIDVSYTCGSQAGFLSGAGIKTVFRYYSRDTSLPAKRMSRAEVRAFCAAGLRLGAVHEAKHGDRIDSFSRELGVEDAEYARAYAHNTVDQPENTAIYFAVDLDVERSDIQSRIIPYFQGVHQGVSAANGLRRYKIGVYGSGAVCRTVLDEGLAELAWLAQARGWAGYKDFLNSNLWSMRQLMPSKVGEMGCDPDVRNPAGPGIGDFFLTAATTLPDVQSSELKVIAREGLRLRSGPGTAFDVLRVIPFGTSVYPKAVIGEWTQIDLEGDGRVDGFVSSHFLDS